MKCDVAKVKAFLTEVFSSKGQKCFVSLGYSGDDLCCFWTADNQATNRPNLSEKSTGFCNVLFSFTKGFSVIISSSSLCMIGKGCGYSTAVEHMPAENNSWDCGFESPRCWAFFFFFFFRFLLNPSLLSFTNGVSLIRYLKRRCISNWVLGKKFNENGCLAVLPGAQRLNKLRLGKKKVWRESLKMGSYAPRMFPSIHFLVRNSKWE